MNVFKKDKKDLNSSKKATKLDSESQNKRKRILKNLLSK